MTGSSTGSSIGSSTDSTGELTELEARWLSSRRQKTETHLDLFCFAHAGGSAGEFLRWAGKLPGIRLWAVKMPGRAPREKEQPYTWMPELVRDLVGQVDFGRRDFAFFGHSLGSLVAFEVTRALRREGKRLPRRLLVSSMEAPPITKPKTSYTLPGDQLLAEIERNWGALPQALHDDPEIRDIVLSYFRADAELAETYEFVPEAPLEVPVTAFVGDEEERFQLGWDVHTSAGFDFHTLRGGHFYFRDPEQQGVLLQHIARALRDEP